MPNFISTKSFKLAVYQKGDIHSSKLALVLPGQLDTKDYPHMRSHVDFLSMKGFFAVSFDPAGTWESGGDFRTYTMTNYLQEIHELIEYFGNKSTFLVGHSRGGSMAMLGAIYNPYVVGFAAIMSYYAFTIPTFTRQAGETTKKLGYKLSKRDLPDDPNQYIEVKLPVEFIEDQAIYDMTDGLANCRKPKMFVVGTKDTIIDPAIVIKGFEIAAQPKKLFSLSCDHDYRRDQNLINKVNGFIGNFLEIYQD